MARCTLNFFTRTSLYRHVKSSDVEAYLAYTRREIFPLDARCFGVQEAFTRALEACDTCSTDSRTGLRARGGMDDGGRGGDGDCSMDDGGRGVHGDKSLDSDLRARGGMDDRGHTDEQVRVRGRRLCIPTSRKDSNGCEYTGYSRLLARLSSVLGVSRESIDVAVEALGKILEKKAGIGNEEEEEEKTK